MVSGTDHAQQAVIAAKVASEVAVVVVIIVNGGSVATVHL